MLVLPKKRILKLLSYFISIFIIIIANICLYLRAISLLNLNTDKINLLSAKFVFPRGKYKTNNVFTNQNMCYVSDYNNNMLKQDSSVQNITTTNKYKSQEINSDNNLSTQDEQPHSPGENTYKIIENQFGAGGTKYENFYVKNSTNFNLNIASELAQKPDINIKFTKDPQVLIMHTHTSEAYMPRDQGFFYESFYPRSTDNSKNVTRVGDAITQKLIKNGINTIHDITYHDVPTYNGSYSRSAKTIKNNLEKFPSIQVVLDIHRDSLGDKSTGKVKPTFKINGKKAAQIMVIAGCGLDKSSGFPDWEKNLRFALRIQQKAETMFPGITRPMHFGNFKYNMNLSHGSVLIEVGSDANTLDEALYTGEMLGDVLSELLNSLKN